MKNETTQSNTTTSQVVCRKAVAEAAYYEWLKAGQPSGRDQEFWLEAESQLCKAALAQAPQPGALPESAPTSQPAAFAESNLGASTLPQTRGQLNGRKRRLKSTRATILA